MKGRKRDVFVVNPIKSQVLLAVVSSFYRDMGAQDSM